MRSKCPAPLWPRVLPRAATSSPGITAGQACLTMEHPARWRDPRRRASMSQLGFGQICRGGRDLAGKTAAIAWGGAGVVESRGRKGEARTVPAPLGHAGTPTWRPAWGRPSCTNPIKIELAQICTTRCLHIYTDAKIHELVLKMTPSFNYLLVKRKYIFPY